MADHHISPGKKQWTWGCGDFGKAWDRNLTDEDGPYIEQYRHTTWLPDDYYLEGLKRDDEAHQKITGHDFQTWEGAEGKITSQFKLSLFIRGRYSASK